MPTGRKIPLNFAAPIHAAFPRDTAKHLERGLGCSPRQAKRIAETGSVPEALKALALRLIDRALESNRAEIARLQEELRRLDHEAMCGRAAARRQEAVARLAAEVEATPDRDEQLFLTALSSFRKDGQ